MPRAEALANIAPVPHSFGFGMPSFGLLLPLVLVNRRWVPVCVKLRRHHLTPIGGVRREFDLPLISQLRGRDELRRGVPSRGQTVRRWASHRASDLYGSPSGSEDKETLPRLRLLHPNGKRLRMPPLKLCVAARLGRRQPLNRNKGFHMSKKRNGEPVQADSSLEQAKKSSSFFKALLTSQHGSPGHDHSPSVREDHHKGHHIVIKTTYEVTVDGKEFTAPLGVSNAGMVQYHGIPNVGFPSAIDLIKCIIDQFPEDFPKKMREKLPADHDHNHHSSAVTRRRVRLTGK